MTGQGPSHASPFKTRARPRAWWAPLQVAALLLTFALTSGATAHAQVPSGGDFGVGLMLGEPSGLTGKYWFNNVNAVDVHMAFDFTDEAFVVFSDYLFHFDAFKLASGANVDVPVYIGVGGKFAVNGDNRGNDDGDVTLGARIPLGVTVLLKKAPLEIFVEIAPGVRIIPSTSGDIDGAIGLRYYF